MLGPVIAEAGAKLAKLAAEHPDAAKALAQTIAHVASSKNPVEAARRAALVTAGEAASEEALKTILGG